MLSIKNLSVALTNGPSLRLSTSSDFAKASSDASDLASYGGQAAEIIKNLNLDIAPGSVHALMGQNGSGKSTLAYTLMGHPNYHITSGSVLFNNQEILSLSPDKRAKLGIFLAFQQPYEIPGITVFSFLKEAHQAISGQQTSVKDFEELLRNAMKILEIDPSFAHRQLHVGFSGGQKKKLEILQMLILQPQLIVLDEIDSGLDIDALKIIAHTLQHIKKQQPHTSILMITHYQRMLDYITPDFVHIMHEGTIISSGDASLVHMLEQKGYDAFAQQ